MTISICVKVHDGVVLASDSATALMQAGPDGSQHIINVYEHANKIFNLYKGLPIGGMTYGQGSIGVSSISTLAKDLRRRFHGQDSDHLDWKLDPDIYTMQQVAEATRRFLFEEHYKAAYKDAENPPPLGFKVAGYSAGAKLSELWDVSISGGQCPEPTLVRKAEECGINWDGEPDAVQRIVLGFGQQLPSALAEAGLDQSQIQAMTALIMKKCQIPMAVDPMPIQDTIDLAEFLVYSTIMFTRFKPGAPTVGGPIESAAITKHEGFKWVRRKHYYDTMLNPEPKS